MLALVHDEKVMSLSFWLCDLAYYTFFFPKGESINLDPELKTACEGDVSDFCSNVSPGQAQVCTEKSGLDVLNAVTKRILLGLFFQISHFDAMTSLKKLYECKPFCIFTCSESNFIRSGVNVILFSWQVIECLKKHQSELSYTCKAKLFKREVSLDSNTRFWCWYFRCHPKKLHISQVYVFFRKSKL